MLSNPLSQSLHVLAVPGRRVQPRRRSLHSLHLQKQLQVGKLLTHKSAEVQTLGALVLAQFLARQVCSSAFLCPSWPGMTSAPGRTADLCVPLSKWMVQTSHTLSLLCKASETWFCLIYIALHRAQLRLQSSLEAGMSVKEAV